MTPTHELSVLPSTCSDHRILSRGSTVARLALPVALVLLAMTWPCSLADASSNRITTESVSNYASAGCPGWDLPNAVPNGIGFRATMMPSGSTFWANGFNLGNLWVMDKDLYDPERTGNSADQDTNRFDRLGDGIAYFTGHGVCDGATNDVCSTTATCTSPPIGAGYPASCKQGPPGTGFPPPGQGWCHYYTPRHAITCGALSEHGNDVNYSSNLVRWGESSQSGTWASAGSNGGVNLVVLDVSCGVNPQFWLPQLAPAFGGIHLIATIMPVTGDTNSVSNRGSTFATNWAVNPSSSVGASWLEVVPDLGGGNCKGGGINGCGCNNVVGYHGDPDTAAWYVINENWYGIKSDGNDATSAGTMVIGYLCNYDVATYPWHLP